MADADFVRRTLIGLALVALTLALWQLANVLLLCFGGLLVAVLLRALANQVAAHTPLSDRWALAFSVLAVVVVLAATSWFVGERVASQMNQLSETLPRAMGSARDWVRGTPIGNGLFEHLSSIDLGKKLASFASSTFGALANTLLIVFLALYLAASPSLYRGGFLALLPAEVRGPVGDAIDASGSALRRWLLGQLVAMLLIGVVTGTGLALLGVPLALSLGLLAGLLEFIPFVGPIAAAVPAILVGFTQGPPGALKVLLLYLAIQQVEGNLLMPVIQRWAVSLPPALNVLSVAVFAVFFGPVGILFATPLMVVAMIMVQKLYVARLAEDGPKSP